MSVSLLPRFWRSATLLAGVFAFADSYANDTHTAEPPNAPPSVRSFGIGVAQFPEYEGAKADMTLPMVMFDDRIGGMRIDMTGMGLRLHLIETAHFSAGPILQGRLGRDDEVDDPVIAKLREIDATVEGGGFAELRWQVGRRVPGEIAVQLSTVQDLREAHEGRLATLSGRYAWMIGERWRFSVEHTHSWADDAYMGTYFAIDADNARRSGLARYTPEEGVKDRSATFSASYGISPDMSVFMMVGVSQLSKTAADSPIVRQRGERDQNIAAMGVMFLF